MAVDLVTLRKWIGRTERAQEVLSVSPALRFLATLDDSISRLQAGDALPPLWHWLYFMPATPMSEVGVDGHPKRGGFLPPVPLPRRMFAASKLSFRKPLIIGEASARHREVASVEVKEGRSGSLVFVEVDERVEQFGQICIEERQTIVYRDIARGSEQGGLRQVNSGPTVRNSSGDSSSDVTPVWIRTVTPDPVLMFRFSALTFNSHRIHYDRSYAINNEGYPGLVVQGPLMAMLLADLLRRNDLRSPASFQFRLLAPVFEGTPIRLAGRVDSDFVLLEAQAPDGARVVEARASFEA